MRNINHKFSISCCEPKGIIFITSTRIIHQYVFIVIKEHVVLTNLIIMDLQDFNCLNIDYKMKITFI